MLYARNYLKELAISSMEPHHDYVDGTTNLCFTNHHEYALYLPQGGNCQLNLAEGTFLMKFYNPRGGEYQGPGISVAGGKTIGIELPWGEDCVIILVKTELPSSPKLDPEPKLDAKHACRKDTK